MHPLSFANSIVFPEAEGPTGGNVYCSPEISWSLQEMNPPVDGWGLICNSGILNLLFNEIVNFDNGVAGTVNDPGAGGTAYTQFPYVNGSSNLDLLPSANVTYQGSGLSGNSEINQLLAIAAFSNEIAQACCAYNASETAESLGPFTGSVYVPPSSGVIRSAKIYCAAPPTGTSYKFGSTGALMLGHFCFEYSGFYGPLRYLNSNQVYAVPEDPSVTGLYLILKPGVSVTVEFGINTYEYLGLQTTLGEINLLNGTTAGFKG